MTVDGTFTAFPVEAFRTAGITVGPAGAIWSTTTTGMIVKLVLIDTTVYLPLVQTALYPSGRIAFVSDRDGQGTRHIFTMHPDGSHVSRLTSGNSRNWTGSWSPDGQYLAFVSDRDSSTQYVTDIYTVRVDGSEVTRLTNSSASEWFPSWSPNGQLIAFGSRDGHRFDLYVMRADGSEHRQLTFSSPQNGMSYEAPSWSPDGRYIVFQASRFDGPTQLYMMDVEQNDTQPLSVPASCSQYPSWSPDGELILFVAGCAAQERAIYHVRPDGTQFTHLAPFPGSVGGKSSWSPDGSRFAIGDEYKISVYKREGGAPILVWPDTPYGSNTEPAWSP
jgi:Tol biopolymer transport system component